MPPYTVRICLMLLGGGNALGQALICLGTEEDIGFFTPRPPEQGQDAASLTTLLDETRPDVVINLVFYYDWFQAEQAEAERLGAQEHAVERPAGLRQYCEILLIQPSSYRVFDGTRAIACSEKGETLPLGLHSQALWRMEQSVHATCPRHVLIRFGWLLDESPGGLLGRFLNRAEQSQPPLLTDDRRDNPTPVGDTAWVVLSVLKQLGYQAPLRGTYHYDGLETITALALGQVILNEAHTYHPNLIRGPSTEAYAVRPDALDELQHAAMICRKVLHTFGIKPRAWRAGLPALSDRYCRHV